MLKNMALDVERVAGDIRRMAQLVEDALRRGVRALRERDRAAAEAAIAGDDEIDRLENEVWDSCHRLLARYQPLAGDLRRIVSLMQVASELERMGDLAGSVAERSLRMLDFPPLPVSDRTRGMADRVVGLVHRGLDSYLQGDTALARMVLAEDIEVDADNSAAIVEIIERMKNRSAEVEPCLSLFSAVRHLERVADHATNIAEDTVFSVEGTVLRHRSGRSTSVA